MRTVTAALAMGILATLGIAGSVTPAAQAEPQFSAAEERYLQELYLFVHPSVTASRLVELGHIACSARRAGATSDQAREWVWRKLDSIGVVSSYAEMGSLVHVAVDNLCPEVGYP